MNNVFDITSYGAEAGGRTDCTKAIQAALDDAGKVCGVVQVPPGEYLTGCLRVPAGVMLEGFHAWAYRRSGASTLVLSDGDQPCLLDISAGFGCTVKGISLEGGRLGERVHGIMCDHADYNGGGEEDTPTLEDCRVNAFSGDGVRLRHIWCFSVRHCMLSRCGGDGLYIDGWDGFILDNWFSGNGGAGMRGGPVIASVTATGNRVEWNRRGGFVIENGNTLNLTGNYFDRSGGPGISLCAGEKQQIDTVSISGNIFYRSGAGDTNQTPPEDPADSAHLRMERCVNCAVSANAFRMGKNDDGKGLPSPDCAVSVRALKSCTISANAMDRAGGKELIRDLGGHYGGVILSDNVGAPPLPGGYIYPDIEK